MLKPSNTNSKMNIQESIEEEGHYDDEEEEENEEDYGMSEDNES